MSQISQLLNQLPQNNEINMTTMGSVLWVSWQGSLPLAVTQTLQNYGGMSLCQTASQGLWFFFTNDVFLALARLDVWGQFNPLPVAIELFPGRLQFSAKREASLQVEGILASQELFPRDHLDIFVHPASKEGMSFIPGITFERSAMRQGMASVDWQTPVVDSRLPYSSTQSWFAVIHPLGNPIDKNFQAGWSAMFERLENIFQTLKMKFIVHDGFVLVSVENLFMLRSFLREYMRVFDKEKRESGAYWPTVCVVSDRRNLAFNHELPKKIGMKWDSLMPDFPYISYRNAYLLGEGFVVRDLRFSGQTNMDSWCNAILDENSVSARSVPLVMSAQLSGSADQNECFYCGLRHHSSAECPTRNYFPSQPDTWQAISNLDLETINAAFRQIETTLSAKGVAGFHHILEKEGPAQTVARAILDLNATSQLRNVPRNWLYRMRDPDPDEETPDKDDSVVWELLEKFVKTDASGLAALDKELAQLSTRLRDARLRMLRAFVCVEREDYNQAMSLFREAAAVTPTPAIQAWNEYLQGRLLESQGQYTQASAAYNQALRVMPHWKDVTYRGIVCRVKMGFAEQALEQIVGLIKSDPEYFNRFLIDPSLERGRLLILSALYDLWEDAKKNSEAEKSAAAALTVKLNDWFPQDHPIQSYLGQRIRAHEAISVVDNYMAVFRMTRARPQLEKELNDGIQREIEELRNRYKAYLDSLEEIRDEASWFPFPSALKEFSADFNSAAGIINWAFSSNFGDAGTFKKARSEMPKLDKALHNLKKRLNYLRAARDATLFGLTFFRTFIWIEIVGLLLCFLGVPGLVFFGDKIGLGWLKYLLGENQWSIQKVLVVIVTILAIGAGALRTTLVFERKKEKLLKQAKEQREKAQATRVEAIRKKRLAQAQKERKEKAEADKREAQRQLKARMQS